jgi:hypothetical protein
VDNSLDSISLHALEAEVYKRRQAIKQKELEDREEVERAVRTLVLTNETVKEVVAKNSGNSDLKNFLDECPGYRVSINIFYRGDDED